MPVQAARSNSFEVSVSRKEFVRSERLFMAGFLSSIKPEQWQASTLCAGWTVQDVAAHVVARERYPSSIGIVIPALHGWHERTMRRIAARGHSYLIAKIRHYPWWMPASLNVAEFYIHNEDILRGGLHEHRPEPNDETAVLLWASLKGLMKVRASEVKDLGKLTIHNDLTSEEIKLGKASQTKQTTISGKPGELLLFCYGRREAAKVTVV